MAMAECCTGLPQLPRFNSVAVSGTGEVASHGGRLGKPSVFTGVPLVARPVSQVISSSGNWIFGIGCELSNGWLKS